MSVLSFCAICLPAGVRQGWTKAGVLSIFAFLTSCAPSIQTNHWEPLGAPEGQNISALIADLHDLSIAFCGSRTGEFFMSTNHGRSWTKQGTIPAGAAIHTLLQHPDAATHIYAATESGIYESLNAGSTWQSLPVLPGQTPQPASMSITFDPWQPMVLFAGFKGYGLFESTDAGRTWRARNGNLGAADISTGVVEEIAIHPSQADLLYCILSTVGAIRTTDGGESWVNLTEKFDASGTVIKRIIVSQENSDLLCIGTGGGDIYRSENGGTTWDLSHQGTGYSPIVNFTMERNNKFIYVSTGAGVMKSDNFGGTWTTAGNGFPRKPSVIVTARDSLGTAFYLYGPGTGVRFVGNDGATWEKADSGLVGSISFSTILTSHNGDLVFAASGRSVYRHDKSGWVSVSEGLPGSTVTGIALDGEVDSLLYVSTLSGPYYSENQGGEWRPLGKSMGGTPLLFIAAHPAITNRLLGITGSGMMVSTDKGISWNRTKPPLRDHEIRSMTFHPANAGIIGAGTSNNGALISSDGGINWDESRYGLEGNEILALTFTSKDQTTYYAWGSDGKGYRSNAKGIEWAVVPQSWLPVEHFAIANDATTPSSVLAFVNQKDLYYSDSGGSEWVKLPAGPPPVPITTLSWSEKSRVLFAGSAEAGLFRISLKKEIDKALKK